jgi:hypothetical protein
MDPLIEKKHFLPTGSKPEVYLDPEGVITIKGRANMLATSADFELIMDWLDKYLADPAETTYVRICIEYLNSYCTAKLLTILKKLSGVILNNKKLDIKWYYEKDDEDLLERGEHVADVLELDMNYVVTADIKRCC